LSALAVLIAAWPSENRVVVELRVEPATLAAGVTVVAPPIEARLEPLVRRVLQEVGSPPGLRILASMRRDGRYLEVSATGDDPSEAAEVAQNAAKALLARDLEDRRDLTRQAVATADSEAAQAAAAARANQDAITLLRPQGIASDAPVTTRALAALSVEAEGRVREDATAVAEREAELLGLEGEKRTKHEQLLDESAADAKLRQKGGRTNDAAPLVAHLPSWTGYRAACAKLDSAEQRLSATRQKLARHEMELERLKSDIEHWPERAQVLSRLEVAQPGLKRTAEDSQARAERAYHSLEIELGKELTKGLPERLTFLGPSTNAPAGPDRQLRLLAGLVFAVPAAFVAAVLREWQDRSLYDPDTWHDALGAPVLGRVPDLSEPGTGVGAP
jgi:hypothetical protein